MRSEYSGPGARASRSVSFHGELSTPLISVRLDDEPLARRRPAARCWKPLHGTPPAAWAPSAMHVLPCARDRLSACACPQVPGDAAHRGRVSAPTLLLGAPGAALGAPLCPRRTQKAKAYPIQAKSDMPARCFARSAVMTAHAAQRRRAAAALAKRRQATEEDEPPRPAIGQEKGHGHARWGLGARAPMADAPETAPRRQWLEAGGGRPPGGGGLCTANDTGISEYHARGAACAPARARGCANTRPKHRVGGQVAGVTPGGQTVHGGIGGQRGVSPGFAGGCCANKACRQAFVSGRVEGDMFQRAGNEQARGCGREKAGGQMHACAPRALPLRPTSVCAPLAG